MTATMQQLGPNLCLLYVPLVRGIALECDMGSVRRFNHGLTDKSMVTPCQVKAQTSINVSSLKAHYSCSIQIIMVVEI